MIYIIGHTKPDLDSAVAAVSLKYLFDKADCFKCPNAQAVLASKANFETKTIFAKFGIQLPKVLTKVTGDDAFILVDHNETTQRLEGITDDQIKDIFDHHKVSVSFSTPIYITTKPWGSTNTIIWWLMEITNVKPDKNLAALMMAAILSDTVGLKSPTTTAKDREVLEKLNKIAQIARVDDLTLEIFKAKASLAGLSNKQILTKDYKLYEFNGKKVLINQVETVEQAKLVSQAQALITDLSNLKKEMNLDKAVCVFTDILKVNSKALVTPEDEELVTTSFPKSHKLKTGVYDLGSLMSRKKEFVPPIEKYMKTAK
jgi:manganese-dependent inorganic pyrophosphatase